MERTLGRTSLKFVLTAMLFALANAPAQAQAVAPPAGKPDAKPEMMQSCPGLIASRPPLIPAAFRLAALQSDQLRITYIGHSTFLLESPQLGRIATD